MRVAIKQNTKHVEVVSKLIICSGGFIGLWNYAKNTMFLNNYKSFVELIVDDVPVEPSLKLSNLVTEVMEDLKDHTSEYTDIQPVIVPGQNIFNMGTCGTFAGGFIGFPAYFESNTIDDIATKIDVKKKMFIQGNEFTNSNDKDAYALFLLSEEAKKYAIAREVLLINNLQVYVDTFLPFFLSFTISGMMTYPPVANGLSALPRSTRVIFYTSVTLGAILLWRKAYSFVKRYFEKQTLEDISNLGENYITGALEYNSKEIQRNTYIVEMKGQSDRILLSVIEKLEQFFVPKSLSASLKYNYFKKILDGNTNSVDS